MCRDTTYRISSLYDSLVVSVRPFHRALALGEASLYPLRLHQRPYAHLVTSSISLQFSVLS